MDNVFNWLLNHLWWELALLSLAVGSVYLSFQTQKVIRLKPLCLPAPDRPQPEVATRADLDLADLGFCWAGDFDASATAGVVMRTRFYGSADHRHHAVLVLVTAAAEQMAMIEFSTALLPRGNISTNNNRQPGVYAYPLEKLVVRAPSKHTIRELFALHQALCGAASVAGFVPRAVSPAELCAFVQEDSRLDMENERARGCLFRMSDETYRTTFKGALLYTPRIWLKMMHGLLFSWYQTSDRTFIARAARRFQRAASRNRG